MSLQGVMIGLHSFGLFCAIIGECTMIAVLSMMLFRRRTLKNEPVNCFLSAHLFLCLLVSYPLFMDKCICSIHGHLHANVRFNDFWCRIKAYLIYCNAGMYFYTVLLQATYRCVRIVYPTRMKLQSFRLYAIVSMLHTMIAYAQVCPSLLLGSIEYLENDYVCQFAPTNVSGSLFICSVAFLFPFALTLCLYARTMYYVRKRGAAMISTNRQARVRRDLTIMTRLVVLLTILTTIAAPHGIIPIVYALTGHIPLWAVPFEWTMTIFALTTVSIIQVFTSPHLYKLFRRSSPIQPMSMTPMAYPRTA